MMAMSSRIADTLRFDGQSWSEVLVGATDAADPLAALQLDRLAPVAGSTDSLGQFAQSIVIDPVTQTPKLLIKLPSMRRQMNLLNFNQLANLLSVP